MYLLNVHRLNSFMGLVGSIRKDDLGCRESSFESASPAFLRCQMGCDIHLFPEWKSKEIGEWEGSGAFHCQRDYRFFAVLGNVRNFGDEPYEFVAANKGLPNDLAWWTTVDIEQGDHSGSWANLKELKLTADILEARDVEPPIELFILIAMGVELEARGYYFRVVFNFDN